MQMKNITIIISKFSMIFLLIFSSILIIQCGNHTGENKVEAEPENTFDSVDVAILWDAMTAVNATANLTMMFRMSNKRWPRGLQEILSYAKISSLPFNGKSEKGWWEAKMDSTLLVIATSLVSMPHGAGKIFTYDIKTQKYHGYGLTFGRLVDAKEDSIRFKAAYTYGEKTLANKENNEPKAE